MPGRKAEDTAALSAGATASPPDGYVARSTGTSPARTEADDESPSRHACRIAPSPSKSARSISEQKRRARREFQRIVGRISDSEQGSLADWGQIKSVRAARGANRLLCATSRRRVPRMRPSLAQRAAPVDSARPGPFGRKPLLVKVLRLTCSTQSPAHRRLAGAFLHRLLRTQRACVWHTRDSPKQFAF